MAVSVFVQYNNRFLPDRMLLTLGGIMPARLVISCGVMSGGLELPHNGQIRPPLAERSR